jgi:hypothetical protein
MRKREEKDPPKREQRTTYMERKVYGYLCQSRSISVHLAPVSPHQAELSFMRTLRVDQALTVEINVA